MVDAELQVRTRAFSQRDPPGKPDRSAVEIHSEHHFEHSPQSEFLRRLPNGARPGGAGCHQCSTHRKARGSAETPDPPASPAAAGGNPAAPYLIAFKDNTIHAATAVWTDRLMAHYITREGAHEQVLLDLVDGTCAP
jgi:hypothetical protein